MDETDVVERFNEAINERDLDWLAALMTEDHAFVDVGGVRISGKDRCLDAWREFFATFPEYENVFERVTCDGDLVTIVGHSVCPDDRMDGPALWTAVVRDEELAEWRVYEDTVENRLSLGLTDDQV